MNTPTSTTIPQQPKPLAPQPRKKTGRWNYIKTHPWMSAIVGLIIVLVIFFVAKAFAGGGSTTEYVFTPVTQGTLVSSVSGTGQMTASSTLNIEATGASSSGVISAVDVAVGDQVQAGQAIASIYDQSTVSALTQAKASLETAQANYNKVADGDNSSQTLAADQLSVTESEQNLINSVNSAYTSINNAVHTSIDPYFANADSFSPIFGITFISSGEPVTLVTNDVQTNINLGYEKASVNNDLTNWQNALASTTDPSDAVALAQNAQTYLDDIQTFANDFASAVSTISLNYTSYQSEVNSAKSAGASLQSAVTSGVSTLNSGIESVQTSQSNYSVQTAPPTTDDLASAQASLDSAEASYQNALANYDNDTVKATFAGKVAAVDVTVGSQAANGTSGGNTIATIISNNILADITLNEVDAAKVQLGQKATLTFSALPNLTLTGTVVEIDTIGTVTQGVVTYGAQISLDATSSEVKPGMSVTANIITEEDQNALMVPSAAVKTQGTTSYVLTANIPQSEVQAAETTGIALPSAPTETVVTTGNSSDTDTEITSGLTAGQLVVLRTVTSGSGKHGIGGEHRYDTGRSGIGALVGGGGGGGFGGGGFRGGAGAP